MKKQNILFLGLLLLAIYYIVKKYNNRISMPDPDNLDETSDTSPDLPIMDIKSRLSTGRVGQCIQPKFDRDFMVSGRSCAGEVINENGILRLGDEGCDVLLLQQRLNSIETQVDILKPNGKFCCRTQAKLLRVMGVIQITLNSFSPDEQIGFDELRAGTKVKPYSYMDVRTFNK